MKTERIPGIIFELISDLQLDAEGLTRLLLDSANSLLEWNMFSGINPVRGMLTGGGHQAPHQQFYPLFARF